MYVVESLMYVPESEMKSLGNNIHTSHHPVLAHKLTKLRDERTDCTTFRHILREVTFYLGYIYIYRYNIVLIKP